MIDFHNLIPLLIGPTFGGGETGPIRTELCGNRPSRLIGRERKSLCAGPQFSTLLSLMRPAIDTCGIPQPLYPWPGYLTLIRTLISALRVGNNSAQSVRDTGPWGDLIQIAKM